MKLDMELKPGDIILLKLLACVLILFFGLHFLILPGIDTHQQLVLEKEELAAQQEEMQAIIDNAPAVEEQIAAQKTTLSELTEDYYPLLENREVDELITGLILEYNLFPVYLGISDTVQAVPEAYWLAADSTSDTSAQTDTELSAVNQSTEGSLVRYTNITNVNVTIRGTEEEIYAFIDNLSRNVEGVQVRSFQLQNSSYIDENWDYVENVSCSCLLAVYTCGGIEEMEETRSE